MNLQFKEEQKFSFWWLWLILIGMTVFQLWQIFDTMSTNYTINLHRLSQSTLLLPIVISLASLLFFYTLKLKTTINSEGIYVHFFPLVKRHTLWKDIEHLHVIRYGFVGGWGIRLWTKYGTVYNTRGQVGLFITLKSGKKFLIGTQKESELKAYIEKHHKTKISTPLSSSLGPQNLTY